MDWQLTCRVCLETGDMVSLFDWDENNEQLSEKFTYCCGIQVSRDDSLPTLICLNCVDRLTFSYQFKQQCIASNETLKECLEEFIKSSSAVGGDSSKTTTKTETITIKQENGVLLQYDLPVEQETTWARSYNSDKMSVVSSAPQPRKRGRPRKYPNDQGSIDVSPYQRKRPKKTDDHQSLTSLLATGNLEMKEEPQSGMEEEELDGDFEGDHDSDPEFTPPQESENEEKQKKRGRPRKNKGAKKKKTHDAEQEQQDVEDVLLQETIMAYSEPIPEHLLNPKPKEKKKYAKKKYHYERSHICETCGAAFTSNASLQAHIRRHLGIKPFVCSICGFKTSFRVGLTRHVLRHTGEKPLQCRVCDRRFYEYGDRTKHESICGYSCVANTALKRHMLRHTGEKPYKCRICERRFADFGTRQKHERLHMGVRPYQCSLCGKAFTYSYVLSNHMLTHTGEKKYSCGPCNKKFTKAHHLKYHNKVHHKELYIQQQLEAEAKKVRQQINISQHISGVITGTIVDGKLQLVTTNEADNEQEEQMQVVEELEQEDDEEKETDRAVAEMQAVELNQEDYAIAEEIKGE